MRIYSIILALTAVMGPAYAKPLATSDAVSVDCGLAIAAALVQVQEDRLFGATREENFAAIRNRYSSIGCTTNGEFINVEIIKDASDDARGGMVYFRLARSTLQVLEKSID